MKTPLRRAFLLSVGWMASTALVSAHPGHDDGHELTWDFGHLAAHPLATAGCAAVLTGAIWLVWQFVRRRTKIQPAPDVS